MGAKNIFSNSGGSKFGILVQNVFDFHNYCSGKFPGLRACKQYPCDGFPPSIHLPIYSSSTARNHHKGLPIHLLSFDPEFYAASMGDRQLRVMLIS